MKKGFALITVLVVLILVALGAATVLQSVGSHNTMKSMNVQELKDQYLAEAGMQYALWVCRTNAGNCSSLNKVAPAVTMPQATTLLEKNINIVTLPTGAVGPYQIKVCVDSVSCTIP